MGNQCHLTFHTSHTFADIFNSPIAHIFNNPKEAESYNHMLHSKFLYPILQRLKEIELFCPSVCSYLSVLLLALTFYILHSQAFLIFSDMDVEGLWV